MRSHHRRHIMEPMQQQMMMYMQTPIHRQWLIALYHNTIQHIVRIRTVVCSACCHHGVRSSCRHYRSVCCDDENGSETNTHSTASALHPSRAINHIRCLYLMYHTMYAKTLTCSITTRACSQLCRLASCPCCMRYRGSKCMNSPPSTPTKPRII